MTTHKEATDTALDGWYETGVPHTNHDRSGMEASIRAYLDARGLVMVPREPTPKMIAAACDVWGVRNDEDVERNITEEIKVALSAAPDPFKD